MVVHELAGVSEMGQLARVFLQRYESLIAEFRRAASRDTPWF